MSQGHGPLEVEWKQSDPKWAERLTREMPGIGNLISNGIAEEFAAFARDTAFSGGVLQTVTGETRDSVRFFKRSPGVFGVRPGSGIPGRLNYLYGLARRGYPAMERAYREFQAGNRPREIAMRIYNAMQSRVVEGE